MTTFHRMVSSLTPRQLEVLSFLARREQWSVGEVASGLGVSSGGGNESNFPSRTERACFAHSRCHGSPLCQCAPDTHRL